MDFRDLLQTLTNPRCWPERAKQVEVIHTHISVVFLVGDHAYKVCKPITLDFLDFSTLERRRENCLAENELNARFAPDVYLGVVQIAQTPDGVRVDTPGEVVEWAVKMRRLDDDDTLAARLERGDLDEAMIREVGAHIAGLHAAASGGPEVARFGRFEVVARNARENFDETRDMVGITVHPDVHARLEAATGRHLAKLRLLIDARAAAGVPRDCHGDLRLQHVYVHDGIRLLDCIEFNHRFRYSDPVSDLAFLVMDLACRDQRELADALADAWFEASGDDEGRELLPFYLAYRSVVRAKVAGFELAADDIAEDQKKRAIARARMHWGYALTQLEPPERRPCLVAVGGLSGTGKSVLAEHLSAEDFEWIRSDAVRKELVGLAPKDDASAAIDSGIYAPERTERTYQTCLDQAAALLEQGGRVLVDATFRENRWREAVLDAGARHGVPAVLLRCEATPEVVEGRLKGRTDDASDAGVEVYRAQQERWEPDSERVASHTEVVDASGTPEEVADRARALLAGRGVASRT